MLYGAGVPNEEMMKNAPHVGIATVWWEGNPVCVLFIRLLHLVSLPQSIDVLLGDFPTLRKVYKRGIRTHPLSLLRSSY